MGCRVWERKRARVGGYRRREVESTPLYRLTYALRDKLEQSWEQRYQADYGCLRKEVLQTLDAFLNCGILAHGCARAECQECGHSIVLAFSCKKRGFCPSCAAKRALLFAEHLEANVLLPVRHRHLVATIPKRLRPFFKFNRALLADLRRAAWETYQEMLEALEPDTIAGAVLTAQTAGEEINFNSHIHGIVSAGAFDAQGKFHEIDIKNTEPAEKIFMHKVLSFLKAQGQVGESVIAEILSRQHSGFSLWLGEVIEPGDKDYQLFLANYIDRGPVANSKMELADDIVVYTTKEGVSCKFEALDFLARLTPHIPEKWESVCAYYGAYSFRSRGAAKKKKQENAQADLQSPATLAQDRDRPKASKTWAALIKKVFEVDPLLCQKCNGQMKIKAFITDTREVARLLKNLGLEPFVKPKPLGPGSRAPPQVFPDDSSQLPFPE